MHYMLYSSGTYNPQSHKDTRCVCDTSSTSNTLA
jgi:hypothetical protein